MTLDEDFVTYRGFPGGISAKEPPANAGGVSDAGSIPESVRSLRGGRGNPLQDFSLENSKDRGDWRAIVHRVTKSWTRLKRLSMHACCYL